MLRVNDDLDRSRQIQLQSGPEDQMKLHHRIEPTESVADENIKQYFDKVFNISKEIIQKKGRLTFPQLCALAVQDGKDVNVIMTLMTPDLSVVPGIVKTLAETFTIRAVTVSMEAWLRKIEKDDDKFIKNYRHGDLARDSSREEGLMMSAETRTQQYMYQQVFGRKNNKPFFDNTVHEMIITSNCAQGHIANLLYKGN